MDIGSCKPDVKDRERIRHHLIDIVDPDFHFTAGEFCTRALKACSDIAEKGKLPLFVGGTGLYIDSFFGGISEIPEIESNIKISLSEEAAEKGLDVLYNELLQADPEFAKKIHPNDRQRIIRGLEVYRGTGKPLSYFFSNKKRNTDADVLFIGLNPDREELRLKIDLRVDKMIRVGLIDEVIALRKMGFGPDLNSMRSIGYEEINSYIDRCCTLDEAIEKIKINTKRYAKKQMTWFKKNDEIIWFKAGETKKIKEKIKNWLN